MELVIKRFRLVLKTLVGMTLIFFFTAAPIPLIVAMIKSANIEEFLQKFLAVSVYWVFLRLSLKWLDRSDEKKGIFSDVTNFFRVPLQWDTIGPMSLGLFLVIRRYFL